VDTSRDAPNVAESAQRLVVSMILGEPSCAHEVLDRLPPSLFTGLVPRRAMEAILETVEGGGLPDLIAVSAILARRGPAMTSQLAEISVLDANLANLPFYERTIREDAMRVAVLEACRKGIGALNEAVPGVGTGVTDAIGAIASAAHEASRNSSRAVARPASEVLDAVIEDLSDSRNSGPAALCSGLRALDGTLGGLRRGQLVVVGGRPSTGKSLILSTFAWEAASRPWEHLG